MDTPAQRFASTRTFGSLDGLRGLAVLGPVWHHTSRGEPLFLAEMGARGVPLFFAISGFLITTLLLRERDRTGQVDLKAFYVRRALRIFPLYYAVLGLYVALVLLRDRASPAGQQFFANLPFFLTYTSNWFVALEGRTIFYFVWSLATEEQFYLVWPSLERWLPRWAPAAVALALALLWLGLDAGAVPLPLGFARTVLLSVPPAICFGVALAHLLHAPRGFSLAWHLVGHRWASVVVAAALAAQLVAEVHVWPMSLTMTALVASCVVREDHALAGALAWRPLATLGAISYGVYLLHMLVLNVVERGLARAGLDSRPLAFGATVVVTFGVASLSHRHFEARFVALKAKWVR